MSCTSNSIDIESIGTRNNPVSIDTTDQDKRQKHISPNDETMKKFMEELIIAVNNNKSTKNIFSFFFPNKKLGKDEIDLIAKDIKRKYRILPSKPDISRIYNKYFSTADVPIIFKKWMIKKEVRSTIGVLVVTIVLSPHKFSCKYDCFYCPQETDLKGVPTQPRSYLSTEPAMLRALNTRSDMDNYDFEVMPQFKNRVDAYKHQGNINASDSSSHKMEIILSGGTWESYPKEYREQVILELYWSANTMDDEVRRLPKTLEEEIIENETAKYRIIGLTLETRPDNITPETIQDYCRWGVTRMQIGVQHFNDAILKKINRKCYNKDTIRAIRLLKQAGFKVVVHLMPDLPGSSPELDKWMFNEAVTNPDLQFDDVKIYPTAVCKSPDPNRIVKSKIADWYNEGLFVPYAEKNLDDLFDVLTSYKEKIQPHKRIQRLVRDIPGKSIESGYHKMSNLRQLLTDRMTKCGKKCYCIYCMEIGDKEIDDITPILVVRKYEASEGIEYHLSVEAHDMNMYATIMYYMFIINSYIIWFFTGKWRYWSGNLSSYTGLFGFLRLRIDPNPGGDFIQEINECALIREVHVYGSSLGVGTDTIGSQHRGFGMLMVKTAEEISLLNGFKKSAVIAGVGTRKYYENKCGYKKGNTYMLKNLTPYDYKVSNRLQILTVILAVIMPVSYVIF
jgi:ELP3 family radical SAM enzyme/protein acetyltransferase